MGFLRQGHQSPAAIPRYTGLQIQTSSRAVPLAILYGANKIAPNVIWTGGFYSVPQYQKQGGKGGGGQQLQGYEYFTSFAMGVCEGPIAGFGLVWVGQGIHGGLYGTGLTFARYGGTPQAPWPFLAAYGQQSLGYNGLAYIAASNYDLGSSPVLPQVSLEVFSSLVGTSLWNTFDADPALVVQDFLTNAQYGVLFPAASIDATTLLNQSRSSTVTITIASPGVVTWTAHGLSNGQPIIFSTTGALPTGLVAGTVYYVTAATANTFQVSATVGGAPINTSGSQSGVHTAKFWDSSYQNYCLAAFLAISPALVNQESANSILSRWLQLTNTAAVWSGGKLKFIPYGDTSFSANGVTFIPNVTPIYNLTDDDFIHEDGKDPLEVTRSDPYESYNWQRIQINARVASYDPAPIDAWDQNAIELYGLRRAPDVTASEICDVGVGQVVAQLILQRQLHIRNTYHFKLSFEYCLLEPMDLVSVTDAALGLTNTAIRITSVEEDDAGLLSVTAEEFPGGTATAVQYPVQPPSPNSTNQAVVPARVNPPVLYEPPSALNGGVAQVWAAVSGGVAPAYKLAEDGSTGVHQTTQTVVNTQASGTTINFSVYVQAVERTAVKLSGNNGSSEIGCDFNLAVGTAGTPDTGISRAAIVPAGGGVSAPVTITIASPGVVTWTAHGLVSGAAVYFTTTGSLPTGLAPNTVYFAIPVTVDTFKVAATPGGAAINTSGSQSGTHSGTASIWFQLAITFNMAALAAPAITIKIENPYGTASYAGTAGKGIYIWGAEYSWNNAAAGTNQPPSFLPAFSTVTNATLSSSSAATPEGVPGVADPNWGGAFVWISTDNATYGQIGTVSAPSRQGVTTTSMSASATAVSVDLEESGGVLLSGTAADAANGITLCLVDNELVAYQTATLLTPPPPNAYSLTGVVRAFYGTTAASHSSGAPFARLDDALFKYTLPAAFIGVPLYLKFQSFNIFGRSVEDLSECAVYTYTPSGSGSPLGPVSQALAAGQSLDFRLVSEVVSQKDQWGIVTDGFVLAAIDLGTVAP